MKKIMKLFAILIVVVFNLSANDLTLNDFAVIKNPKSNMVEKEYVRLIKIRELTEDLQEEEFIYKPLSITGDGEGVIYVYDSAQAKLFKLDHQLKILDSFGQIGRGPGEFFGNRWPVYLSIGLDGMLYARDAMAFKVMKYSKDFKFIQEYRYHQYGNYMPGEMQVDTNGNIYFYKVKDNVLICRNQDKKILLQIPVSDRDVGSLFYKKPKSFAIEFCIRLAIVTHPELLVFFEDTAALFVVKENKVIKKMNLWPRDALADYKTKLKEVVDRPMNGFTSLFHNFFIDRDDKNIFYLQYGKNETKGINTLYKFTIKGELQKVLYVKNQKPHINFHLKQDNKFFARSGEKLIVYKEENK